MTYSELEVNVNNLKFKDSYCNLFKKPQITDMGLYVVKNRNIWEVYHTECGSAVLVGIFYKECNLYEYIYCYFKKMSDVNCWFGGLLWDYPQDLIRRIKKFKIPESEYSFEGTMRKNCMCVEQIVMTDDGSISHQVLRNKDGIVVFDITHDHFEKNSGKAPAWQVYYSDGKEKLNYGIFFIEKDAYDFLFYLVMRKYVSIKKHWWYMI